MATTRPRITVTLTHRQHEILSTISQASGQSMSAYIVDLLESCEPVLERMAATMQRLKALNDTRKASVAAALDEAPAAIEPVMNAVIGQFDLFASQVERAVGAADAPATASGVASAPAKAAAIPRPVITGDRPPQKVASIRAKTGVAPELKTTRKARSRAL